MPIAQAEADRLLHMPKEFLEEEALEFSLAQPMNFQRQLISLDRRERFILDVERGRRKRTRLKYQTRGREVIILARLELDGPDHINPPNAPQRPGERIRCPHIHIYLEDFEDRVALPLDEVIGLNIRNASDGVSSFEDFLKFCGVQQGLIIQLVT